MWTKPLYFVTSLKLSEISSRAVENVSVVVLWLAADLISKMKISQDPSMIYLGKVYTHFGNRRQNSCNDAGVFVSAREYRKYVRVIAHNVNEIQERFFRLMEARLMI